MNKLNLLFLKFTHGVEIGARQAYLGHYARTGDLNIKNIAEDELEHQLYIERVLNVYETKSSPVFDIPFYAIGKTVGLLCLISPLFALNKVANILEKFAVFSYNDLALRFPVFKSNFLEMAAKELEHEKYFTSLVP